MLSALVLVPLLAAITIVDVRTRTIPDRLTGAGALLALGLTAAAGPGGLPGRLIAGVAAGGFLLVPALLRPDGLGLGDVKLAAVLGLFLGGRVALALAVALAAGAVAGAVIVARRGLAAGRRATIPFAPCLALGALAALAAGAPAGAWPRAP